MGTEMKMNIFQKHINWTLALSYLILLAIGFPLLSSLGNSDNMVAFWIVFVFIFLIYYSIYDWALSQKGWKSHKTQMGFGWFILAIMGGLGILILIILKNKSLEEQRNV